jgi:hypothetical protein
MPQPDARRIEKFHEVLDLIEQAHDLVAELDAPTAEQLHAARCQLERVASDAIFTGARALWRERPMEATR